MLEQSTHEIRTRLSRKDHTVIGELYDAYNGALYGVILNIVKDIGWADQVLQDTFVKVWKNGDSYDPSKGRLFTWMLNIARNTAIDVTRSAHFKHCKCTDEILESNFHEQTGYSQIDYLDISEHVAKLEEKYRILIEMAYFKGYTQEEISEEMYIPIGTIKTRIRCALGKLREIFLSSYPMPFPSTRTIFPQYV